MKPLWPIPVALLQAAGAAPPLAWRKRCGYASGAALSKGPELLQIYVLQCDVGPRSQLPRAVSLRAYSVEGKLLWSYRVPIDTDNTQACDNPPEVSPLDGSVHFMVSNTATLHVVSPDGRAKLRYELGPPHPGWAGPFSNMALAADGSIFLGSSLLGKDVILAIAANGTKLWTQEVREPWIRKGLVAADGSVVICARNEVLAFTRLGDLRWRYATGDLIHNTPATDGNETVYVGGGDGSLHAIDLASGSARWRFATGNGVWSSPTVGADGTIFVGGNNGYVHAVFPNGTERWRYSLGGAVWASPAVAADGTVIIARDAGDRWPPLNPGDPGAHLHAIFPNGTLRWRLDLRSRVGYSSAVVVKDAVFISDSENLYCFGRGIHAPDDPFSAGSSWMPGYLTQIMVVAALAVLWVASYWTSRSPRLSMRSRAAQSRQAALTRREAEGSWVELNG